MKHILLVILLFVVHPASASDSFTHSYNGLLKDYITASQKQGVNANLVDYASWGNDARHGAALNALKALPVPTARNEKLAYWINAYNFLTVDLIVREKETESIKNLGNIITSPWKKFSWTLHGKTYTLDEIEHDILRNMNEPRIHVAINCASLSCPDLHKKAYNAASLDVQLTQQTKAFLSDKTKGMKLSGNELTMSKIFDWFGKDFGSKKEQIAFLQRYNSAVPADAHIEGYLDYNWKLNSQ